VRRAHHTTHAAAASAVAHHFGSQVARTRPTDLARFFSAGSSKEAGTPQSADACSLGSTPSSEPEVSATGAEAATPQQSSPPAPEESTISDARRSSIRRNYTASAALSQQGGEPFGLQAVRRPSAPNNSSPGMRRNTSAATLCELRRREESAMSKSDASLQGSRASVVEAVACRMLELILGQDAALSAMRLALAAAAAAAASPTDESSLVSPPAAAPSAQIGGASGSGSNSAGSSSSSSLADDEMRLSALRVPTNISTSVQVRRGVVGAAGRERAAWGNGVGRWTGVTARCASMRVGAHACTLTRCKQRSSRLQATRCCCCCCCCCLPRATRTRCSVGRLFVWLLTRARRLRALHACGAGLHPHHRTSPRAAQLVHRRCAHLRTARRRRHQIHPHSHELAACVHAAPKRRANSCCERALCVFVHLTRRAHARSPRLHCE
jgi:hypothetical protein